jgi:hypothetical protein
MIGWVRHYAFPLGLLAIFIVAFWASLYVSNSTTFADPDSFYHLKIAQDIAHFKDIRQFPWLPFTVLNSYYTDQHFLYHVFLAPFSAMPDPFAGAKLATSLLIASFAVVFTWMLKALHVRFPGFYTLVLLGTSPFIFRVSLVKAPAFSLLILFLGLLFAWRGKWLAVGIMSAIYVWSYGGFILLPAFVVLLAALRLFSTWIHESHWLRHKHLRVSIEWAAFFRRLFTKADVRNVLATILGTVAAVVANPFFPNNLHYLNDQLIQIGIINYQNIIGVGGEWYPYRFLNLITGAPLVSALLIIAVTLACIWPKRLTLRSAFTFVLYVFFFAFTLKSRRYVEYYIPFSVLFAATVISDVARNLSFSRVLYLFSDGKLRRYTLPGIIFIIYTLVAIGIIAGRQLDSAKRDLAGGFSYTADRKASLWLKSHTPKNSIIVHSDWDEFPYLLYWNDRNRYIAGLDPTFLYKADKTKYWAWVNMTTGRMTQGISQSVTEQFHAGYVLLEKGHDVFLRNLDRDPNLRRVYEDEETIIFAHTQAPIL